MTRTPLAFQYERSPRIRALVLAMVDLCRRKGLDLPGRPAAVKEPWKQESPNALR